MSNEKTLLERWLPLRFSGSDETRFQRQYETRFINQIRTSLLLAVVLIAAYGILDKVLMVDAQRVLLIRFAFCVPVVILGYALTFIPLFRTRIQPLVALVSVLTGVGITTMTGVAANPARYLYYAGLILVLIYVYTFIRLQFSYALGVSLLLTAYYEILAIYIVPIEFGVLLSNTFMLVSCNVVGAVACYKLEDGVRIDCAQQWLLAEQTAEIQKQQELAESLLLNALPPQVAEELKQKGTVAPRYHDSVSILFTDFKGFTESTTRISAEELIFRLNDYFTAFDTVMERYHLEKLKTIGDSYLCVGGLLAPLPSHAVDSVLAAFEIIEEVEARGTQVTTDWSIRIGLHTGPVISGIVGIRRFAFDVWGESVNLASRFESGGSPNRVNLSASSFARVKDFFECEYRGKLPTKEGHEHEMYFAIGVLPALLVEIENGIPVGFARRYKTYFHRDLTVFPKSLLSRRTPAKQQQSGN